MARLRTVSQKNESAAGEREPVTEQQFLAALADDFALHGLEVIEQMREKTPAAYALLALQAMQARTQTQQLAQARDAMMMSALYGAR